jgi:hypothetical protein
MIAQNLVANYFNGVLVFYKVAIGLSHFQLFEQFVSAGFWQNIKLHLYTVSLLK